MRAANLLRRRLLGDADAQYNLGTLYFVGQDVPQDYTEAVRWLRRAAEQGNANGQAAGVPTDYITAHMWLNVAGAQNHENARRARDHIRCDMSVEQITEAQQRVRAWSPILTR